MKSENEGATPGAGEEAHWNVRYDDTGQRETAQMEKPEST